MREFKIENYETWINQVTAGEVISLSGTVYTARDAAHKRIMNLLDKSQPLPFPLEGAFIYYAGSSPAKHEMPIGSCGPTTSARMDIFTPRLLSMGVKGIIGKGQRDDYVKDAFLKYKAVYFCAVGGAGALAASRITSCEVIAFEELGCEAIKKLKFENFPLYVAYDCHGGNIFEH